jgi:GxxExxY protein
MSIFYDYPTSVAELNSITEGIIGAAIQVHRTLGPGLLESAYEACLSYELHKRGLVVESQIVLPIFYDGNIIDAGYRIDMLVERQVIVELKAIERLIPVHEAQIISYLKLSGKKIGLLINFNVLTLKDGIKRLVSRDFSLIQESPVRQ